MRAKVLNGSPLTVDIIDLAAVSEVPSDAHRFGVLILGLALALQLSLVFMHVLSSCATMFANNFCPDAHNFASWKC
jgi:hypothetical protein